MIQVLLPALLACARAGAQPQPPAVPRLGSAVKLVVYDDRGHVMDLPKFLGYIGRADAKSRPDPAHSGIMVTSPDGSAGMKPALTQEGSLILLSWDRLPRVKISLPWPVADDGFSTVWIDKGGEGYRDGDVVYLNEEIATSEYRAFQDALERHEAEMVPAYKPGRKSKKRFDKTREELAKAQKVQDARKRAKAFDRVIHDVSLSWEKLLFEHGLQMALDPKRAPSMRFGLTLDESILDRIDQYPWIVDMIKRSGANWVRLVFRANPADFTYSRISSFNEYDGIVAALRKGGIRVMGTILDTNQWPTTLTPEIYAARTRNLVLHYEDQIKSWEIGVEINGDWLGGLRSPLPQDTIFRIHQAAAAQVKRIDPGLETVTTLYWWDGTAPDASHSLFGWLERYQPRGFGRDVDVVGLSLWPGDNPVGMAFDRIFERVSQYFPDKHVMLTNFGYVEDKDLHGYWWLAPDDVEGGRRDLMVYYTTAACAFPRSLCGGFWWQTLDQILPQRRRSGDLYRVFSRTLQQLGR